MFRSALAVGLASLVCSETMISTHTTEGPLGKHTQHHLQSRDWEALDISDLPEGAT